MTERTQTVTVGGWPDPSKPGVPMNPEKDGWHWLQAFNMTGPTSAHWNAKDQCYFVNGLSRKPEHINRNCGWLSYEGPCLTPTEVAHTVATLVAQARKEGAEQMRELCAKYHDDGAAYFEECGEEARTPERLEYVKKTTELHRFYATRIRSIPLSALPEKEVEKVSTVCTVCKGPQHQTPSGLTCENGHGGDPGENPA